MFDSYFLSLYGIKSVFSLSVCLVGAASSSASFFVSFSSSVSSCALILFAMEGSVGAGAFCCLAAGGGGSVS